jgi:hypothetical protein
MIGPYIQSELSVPLISCPRETREDLMTLLGKWAESEALRGSLVAVEQQESASLVGELAPEPAEKSAPWRTAKNPSPLPP